MGTKWLTSEEAANLLGITRETVHWNLGNLDHFPRPKMVGRTPLFRADDLNEWRRQHPARRRRTR